MLRAPAPSSPRSAPSRRVAATVSCRSSPARRGCRSSRTARIRSSDREVPTGRLASRPMMSRRSTGIARRSRSAVSSWVFSSASDGSRGSESQASTRSIHCSAGGFDTQASKWSVGTQCGDSSLSSATSRAADATSIVRAVRAQSACSRPRAAAKSRSDRPPLRRMPGGCTDQSSSRSRTSASASRACRAAWPSTSSAACTSPWPAPGGGHSGTGAVATSSRTGTIARSPEAGPQSRASSTRSSSADRQAAGGLGRQRQRRPRRPVRRRASPSPPSAPLRREGRAGASRRGRPGTGPLPGRRWPARSAP